MKSKRCAARHNNYILIIFDSCRYDTLVEAKPKTICKLGELEQRWSYASWTAPSHYNLLIGSAAAHQPEAGLRLGVLQEGFPASSPSGSGIEGIGFKSLDPQALLPGIPEESRWAIAPTPWCRCRC